MRRYIRELKPTSVLDLAAMVALFRPGPMDNIPAYIRRKHGQEPVTLPPPAPRAVPQAKTYGIFVYQEDIMSAAIALGGFTGPEADTLGYAIRKKKSTVLRAQKEKFVTQAAERGVRPQVIDAGLHGLPAVRALRLQQGPRDVLRADRLPDGLPEGELHGRLHDQRPDGLPVERGEGRGRVAECRRIGIEVLLPDVHRSGVEFTVEGQAIRFGLLAVKNVGQSAIESIIAARDAGGPFKSLRDFCERVDLRLVNCRVIEALAWVGALSEFGHPVQIIEASPTIRRRPGGPARAPPASSRSSTWAPTRRSHGAALPPTTEAPLRERLRKEKELLGLYLSEHPMGEVAEQVGAFVTAYSGDLKDESLDGQRVVIGGIVTGFRTVITKSKSTMGIATLEDLQGTIEVVVFPRMYETTVGAWTRGRSCWSPDGSTIAARTCRCSPTSSWTGTTPSRSARSRSRARSRPATGGAAATGRAGGTGGATGTAANGNGWTAGMASRRHRREPGAPRRAAGLAPARRALRAARRRRPGGPADRAG